MMMLSLIRNPDKRTYESIDELINIARNDIDGFVRRKAEGSANIIREWVAAWANKPLTINAKSEVRHSNLTQIDNSSFHELNFSVVEP